MTLRLTHLTVVGASVPAATVEFGDKLTLVRGPSDTGKSFIVSAIDFMLGASNLKEIPERDGYSTVLLGLQLVDDQVVTLSRPVTGGAFGLHRVDVRSFPVPEPDESLSAKHSPTSAKNVSRYLLQHIGLDGMRVRKNAKNATNALSFRDLAHLCLVDETQMQAETSPALTGQYVNRTKEVSVLKVLLQGEDDSHLIEQPDKREKSRLDGAKVEVIDRLLADLEARLSDTAGEAELKDQLMRVTRTIEQESEAVSRLTERRSRAIAHLREAQDGYHAARSELSEVSTLQARFGLLGQQYESDLRRLATIEEAGNLLGYFTPGVCAFCGAEPEHQHYNNEGDIGSTAIRLSVSAEIAKTRTLHSDLRLALDDLRARHENLRRDAQASRTLISRLEIEVRDLDQQLAPQTGGLRELLTIRGQVEKSLGLYEQVAELRQMRTQIEDGAVTDSQSASEGIRLPVVREFSAEISRRLNAWGFDEADAVRYDRSKQDIQVGDQYRSSHGKGVRAVLHAAFTLGLAKYCFDREMPHPGFVVLDSPLVTYRPPDAPSTAVLDVELPEGVVGKFYRDLQENFDGQVIVMENLDPTEALDARSVDVSFSHRTADGRYGFFPIGPRHREHPVPE